MTVSAFGVDDHRIGKADNNKRDAAISGGLAATGFATRAVTGAGEWRNDEKAYRHRDAIGMEQVGAAFDRRPNHARSQRIASHTQAAAKATKAAKMYRLVGHGGTALAGAGIASLAAAGIKAKKKEKLGKALGDSRKAQNSEERKKAGLGAAGVGYLTATRGKELAPDAAEMLTRSPKKIGPEKHFDLVARRTKLIRRGASRGGVALTGAGLALAGEGFVSGLHHRKVFDDAKEKLGKRGDTDVSKADDVSSAFLTVIAKADDSERNRKAGKTAAIAGGGTMLASGPASYGVERHVTNRAIKMQRAANKAGRSGTPKELKTARMLGRVARGARIGGGVGTAAGLGLGVTGTAVYAANRKKDPVAKAFDPERQRHRRADMEAGALSGGAVVAGGGAAALGVKASRNKRTAKYEANEAAKKRSQAVGRLGQMQTKSGSPGHVTGAQGAREVTHTLKLADQHGETAARLARNSRRFGRGAIGTALGAGALGASAVGLHRSDRKGSGRSYAY